MAPNLDFKVTIFTSDKGGVGTTENHEITEALISVIFAVCRDYFQMP